MHHGGVLMRVVYVGGDPADPGPVTVGTTRVPLAAARADHRYLAAAIGYADRVYDTLCALHATEPVDVVEFADPAAAYTTVRARRLLARFPRTRLVLPARPATPAPVPTIDDAVYAHAADYSRRHHARAGAPAGSSRPLVSIVIPVHDDSRFLSGAVESALRCGYAPVQVIVVDDGSTEPQTVADLADLRAAGQVTVLRRAHEGLAATRNAGIAAAHGRYVVPLDADDLLPDGFLGPAVAAMERHDRIGALSGTVRNFGLFDSVTVPLGYVPDVSLVVNTFARATAVFRTDAVRAVGGYDTTLPAYEDWDLYLRLHKAGRPVETAPVVGHLYRRHPDSMTFRLGEDARVALAQRLLHTHADLLDGDRAVPLMLTLLEFWKRRYEPSASTAWQAQDRTLVAGEANPA